MDNFMIKSFKNFIFIRSTSLMLYEKISSIISYIFFSILMNNMIHNLISAIEIKIKKEEANYELIKEFVDEL